MRVVDASEGGRAVVDVSLRGWSGSMWPQRALGGVESINRNSRSAEHKEHKVLNHISPGRACKLGRSARFLSLR